MLSRCVEAVPRRRARALLLSGVRAAQREMGHFLFALGCINFGAGVLTGLALWALGLANPVLWAVVVAILNFVPYLGPLTSIGLLLLAGMISFNELPAMLAPAGAYALIHVIESNLLSPWVLGRRADRRAGADRGAQPVPAQPETASVGPLPRRRLQCAAHFARAASRAPGTARAAGAAVGPFTRTAG
jgi:hypothetical protein